MQCPFCNSPDTRVIDSRLAEEGTQVRRRRGCEQCEGRFTTFEKAQLTMPSIVKRSGTPQPFSEIKLRRGFESAVYKRPVNAEQIDLSIQLMQALGGGLEPGNPAAAAPAEALAGRII